MNDGSLKRKSERLLIALIIKSLLVPCNRKAYGRSLEDAAQKLGKSKRTVRRLLKAWKERGLASLAEVPRADKGKPRKSEYWYNLAVKIYLLGNKGTYEMSRAEVYRKIAYKAYELAFSELEQEISGLYKEGLCGEKLEREVQKLIQTKEKASGFEYCHQIGKPPSRRTVERWLKPFEENKRKKLATYQALVLPNHP